MCVCLHHVSVHLSMCPCPLADGNSFFGHGFRIRDVMLHNGLEQFIFILPIKRRLDRCKHTLSFPVIVIVVGSNEILTTVYTHKPVQQAFHRAELQKPTSPPTSHKADKLWSTRHNGRNKCDSLRGSKMRKGTNQLPYNMQTHLRGNVVWRSTKSLCVNSIEHILFAHAKVCDLYMAFRVQHHIVQLQIPGNYVYIFRY